MGYTTDNGRVSYLRESAVGVLPTSPTFQQTPALSDTFNYTKTVVESAELDGGINPADTVKVGAKSAGAINIEWQPAAYDDLLEAAFRGMWGNAVDSTGAHGIVASTRTLTATGAFADAVVGQWVLLSGFVAGASYTGAGNSPNNGWFQIETKTSANAVVLADPGGKLVDEIGPVTARVKSSRLINGARKISHAVEIALLDAQTYFLYGGQYVNGCTMTVTPGAIVTGDFQFMGQDVVAEQGVQSFTGAVSVAAASRTITATGAFTRAVPGQQITLSGLGAGNNVTGVIATKVSDNAVTLTPAATTLVDENLAVNYTGVVTVTALTRTVEAIGAFAGVEPGRTITITGMTTSANNVTGVVATVTAPDSVTLTAATTGLVNETGPGTANVASAVGANGANIIGAAPSWSSAGTYAPKVNSGVFNATNNAGDIYVDGVLSTSCYQSLDFTLTNNLRETVCIGSEFPNINYGIPAVTGKFQNLFADVDLWRKMHDHATIALDFGFIGTGGVGGLHFSFPAIRINTDPIDLSGGRNTDVFDKVDWTAQRYTNLAGETYYAMICKA